MARLALHLQSLFNQFRPRIKRDIVPEPKPSTFPLPLDILFLIADELDPLPLRCLALTCRGVYFHLSPLFSRETLDDEDLLTLLLHLEKEVPCVYYCFACQRLHCWDPSWTKHNVQGYKVCKNKRRVRSCFHLDGYRLDHAFMRLVMNRHLYGASHGLPLESIKQNNQYVYSKDRIIHLQTWCARIIQDELILRSIKAIWHTHNDPAKLREFIDTRRRHILPCWHAYFHDAKAIKSRFGSDDRAARVVGMERPVNEVSDGYFTPCNQLTSFCQTCESDFETDIQFTKPPKGREGWVVKITGYHRLGDTRDPRCRRLKLFGRGWEADGERDLSKPSPRRLWLAAEAQDVGRKEEELRVRSRREHARMYNGQRDGVILWW